MIYRHKLSGDRMRIIRSRSEGIATCELIDKPERWVNNVVGYQRPHAVCQIENLEPIGEETQGNLFHPLGK